MKNKHSISPQNLDAWDVLGPKSLKRHPIPKNLKVNFSSNPEINSKIILWTHGNSTKLSIDAIVNAANKDLEPGGGICGSIFQVAGPQLNAACKKLKKCKTGSAVRTDGYKLPCKYVIHAVGPVGEHPRQLESTYKSVLNFVDGDEIKSVALCSISTGIFGYPVLKATKIAMRTVRIWLEDEENRKKTDFIVFVVFNSNDVKIFYEMMHKYFPLPGHGMKEHGKNEKKSDQMHEKLPKSGDKSENSDKKKPRKSTHEDDKEDSNSDKNKQKKSKNDDDKKDVNSDKKKPRKSKNEDDKKDVNSDKNKQKKSKNEDDGKNPKKKPEKKTENEDRNKKAKKKPEKKSETDDENGAKDKLGNKKKKPARKSGEEEDESVKKTESESAKSKDESEKRTESESTKNEYESEKRTESESTKNDEESGKEAYSESKNDYDHGSDKEGSESKTVNESSEDKNECEDKSDEKKSSEAEDEKSEETKPINKKAIRNKFKPVLTPVID